MRKPVDAAREPSSWARYLRRAQNRPGWSIARLAAEASSSGMRIGADTLFKMLADRYDKLTVKQVIAIASALGDDPEIALRAAGDLVMPEHADPRLWRLGLRPDDPTVGKILQSSFDDDMKAELLEQLSIRRAVQLELQRKLEASEVEEKEEFWLKGKRQA